MNQDLVEHLREAQDHAPKALGAHIGNHIVFRMWELWTASPTSFPHAKAAARELADDVLALPVEPAQDREAVEAIAAKLDQLVDWHWMPSDEMSGELLSVLVEVRALAGELRSNE